MIDMTYGDVIDENLLNEFTEDQKEKIKKLVLNNEKGYFIDIEEICCKWRL
ncbi:Uncharacterised protein [Staphylococcus aureus]|uniref:hypothetical protein n=1 Tax=Staphylococcus aureus TaxID=1280 RepID=UPI0007692C50|nr:hypothetical protein [Staphylococcus aureus]CAC8625000.1 Uncharacterised protein [Staphylococcus aureus]CXS58680.1 Uncharacterised protein [Staphylococcus aureus]